MQEPATQRHLDQILHNISEDERLNAEEKVAAEDRARDQLAALTVDPNLRSTIWDTHCATGLAGLSVAAASHPGGDNVRLGNIWAMRSFETSVGRQLRCSQTEASRLVELACKAADERDADEEDELIELTEQILLRDDATCWLFGGDEATDPFAGVDYGALSCRLGLPYRVGETYVRFAVVPPNDTRRPCVLDASWYFQQLWRPGGRTRVFCEAAGGEGLDEWIATPPLLKDTVGPISVETVVDGNPPGTLPYDVP